jgi:hypothetical protein
MAPRKNKNGQALVPSLSSAVELSTSGVIAVHLRQTSMQSGSIAGLHQIRLRAAKRSSLPRSAGRAAALMHCRRYPRTRRAKRRQVAAGFVEPAGANGVTLADGRTAAPGRPQGGVSGSAIRRLRHPRWEDAMQRNTARRSLGIAVVLALGSIGIAYAQQQPAPPASGASLLRRPRRPHRWPR